MDKYYKILDAALNIIAPGNYGSAWAEQNGLLHIAKVQRVLLQLMRKKRVSKTLRVLDFGSGVGTNTLALLDLITLLDNLCELFGEESFFDKVEISSIEGSENTIKVYLENVRHYMSTLTNSSSQEKISIISPIQADITDHTILGKYDLIVRLIIINELDDKSRKQFVIHQSKNLTTNGDIVLIEPATEAVDLTASNSLVHQSYSKTQRSKFIFSHVNKENITYLLKRLWGFDGLREGQFNLIEGALMGKDMLGILPTGAGKSICYLLPALLGSGVSLIVSPRKSLIHDQITNLMKRGFENVDYIDRSKSADERRKIFSRVQAGRLKLVYVSPESLQMRDLQLELKETLKNFSLDYLIIDEAHCVSEWGHDFRPSYIKLIEVVTTVVPATIIAVTATASPSVKEDILDIFKIKEENVICSKFLDRREISLQVINLPIESGKEMTLRKALMEDLPKILHKKTIHELHKDDSGVIFTIFAKAKGSTTRSYGTKYILNEVRESGIESNLYHSKLSEIERSEIQDDFKTDKFPLLVTTMGYGMGIDKSNIRYIIHMCYSNSLEAYYQEVGRSGRDGQHAHAMIISRARTLECIQHQESMNDYEPQCIYGWRCKYTNGTKCDYGMQAKLISDHYPKAQEMTCGLNEGYQFLVQNSKGNPKFTFAIDAANSSKYQTYLFYFQRQGLIMNYSTLSYLEDGRMEFEVEVNHSVFIVSNLASVIEPIVTRLQSYKRQRYNMLESIWEYVNNDVKCRRQFLMDYFQDPVNYGREGCKFCDVEGISEGKSISVTRTLKIDQLFADYHRLMATNSFDYDKANKLLKHMYEENKQESAKIRAMKQLEDKADNLLALYFRSLITLKRDKTDAYARNQAYELVSSIFRNKGTKAAIGVLNDIIDIDRKLAEEILIMNEPLIINAEVATDLMEELKSDTTKEIVYKLFINHRINTINHQLGRRN
ncbi:MAG TPA: hypothetical protein DD730_15795 [Desulfosporosinus sp.]|nr:hypothetical protein [Desulfosporosinus sp.]